MASAGDPATVRQAAPVVRPARPDDVPLIHRLICELAEYERALDEVEASPDEMMAMLSADPGTHIRQI